MKDRTVGFIGLGIMGRPIALNLCKAGVPLLVYDVNQSACEIAVQNGARDASLQEIGSQCDIIFLMVPNGQVVESILFGEGNLSAYLKKDSIICDMSSISGMQAVTFSRRIVQQTQISYMDAPVSGGEQKAVSGELTIMAGGSEHQFQTLLPYFQVIGKIYIHVGSVGKGCVMKLCNQIVVTANIAAICESVAFAEVSGIDLETLFYVLKNGSASSTMLNNRAQKLLEREFQPGAAIQIHLKDIKNIIDTAQEEGGTLPLTSTIKFILEEHCRQGFGHLDSSSLLLYFEQQYQQFSNPLEQAETADTGK